MLSVIVAGHAFIGKVAEQQHLAGLQLVPYQWRCLTRQMPCAGVWQRDRDNVVRVRRYYFFPPVPEGQGQSHLEAATDEPGGCGQLEQVSRVLQEAHRKFFIVPTEDSLSQDLRSILAHMRSQILSGCHVTFSRVRVASLAYCSRSF
jgi:hypothetical protein